MPTLFTQIINQEIPSYSVFENQYVYAFLDITPIAMGHTLIVPKVEVDHFADVPDPYYTAVFQAAQELSRAIDAAVQCDRVGMVVEGFVVPHFHVHLIPMNKNDSPKFERERLSPAADEMTQVANKIISHLDRSMRRAA